MFVNYDDGAIISVPPRCRLETTAGSSGRNRENGKNAILTGTRLEPVRFEKSQKSNYGHTAAVSPADSAIARAVTRIPVVNNNESPSEVFVLRAVSINALNSRVRTTAESGQSIKYRRKIPEISTTEPRKGGREGAGRKSDRGTALITR